MWLFNNFGGMPNFSTAAKNHKTWAKLAAWENETQYQETFTFLANLWLNKYKIENLPKTCWEPALWRTLFFYGRALFFRDDEPFNKKEYPFIDDMTKSEAYWHTPVTLGQGLNIYYEHIKRTAYSYDYTKEFNINNSVLIRANRLMFPPYIATMIYAQKITDASRGIDVVSKNMKAPFIIEGEETDLASIERFYSRLRNNEDAILTATGWMEGKFKITPTSQTNNGQTLAAMWDHKTNLYNEYLTRRGTNNVAADKKERLVVSETEANDALIDEALNAELDALKDSIDQINEMFSLDLSIDLRHNEEEGEMYGLDNGLDPLQGERNGASMGGN